MFEGERGGRRRVRGRVIRMNSCYGHKAQQPDVMECSMSYSSYEISYISYIGH